MGSDVYARVGDPSGIAAPERNPATGRRPRLGGGDGDRPGKRRSQSPDPAGVRAPRTRWLVAAGIALGAILLIAGAVIALGGDDEGGETVTADGRPGAKQGSTQPSGDRQGTTAVPTTTRPRNASLAGTWRTIEGPVITSQITGTDARYDIRITSSTLACSEKFTEPPVTASISKRADGTYGGTEYYVNSSTCQRAGEGPFTITVLDDDHLRFQGRLTNVVLERV